MFRTLIKPMIKPLAGIAQDTGRGVAVTLAGLGIFSLGNAALELAKTKATPEMAERIAKCNPGPF